MSAGNRENAREPGTQGTQASPVFETERMVATPWSLDHAEAAWEIYRLPEVVRYMGGEVQETVDDARAKIAFLLKRNASWPRGYGSYPLFRRKDGRLIGVAVFKFLPDVDNQASEDTEIGWHLHPEVWGQGYATEAGRALIDFGFGEQDLSTLHAVVEPPNTKSCAVARRLGMHHNGQTRKYYGGIELEHFVLQRPGTKGP